MNRTLQGGHPEAPGTQPNVRPEGRDTSTNMVRRYRRWQELSQADLAKEVGVARQTISNIEKGNYSPSVHLALHICRVLGHTVEQVFGNEQEQVP